MPCTHPPTHYGGSLKVGRVRSSDAGRVSGAGGDLLVFWGGEMGRWGSSLGAAGGGGGLGWPDAGANGAI